jgi:hypothetical protein
MSKRSKLKNCDQRGITVFIDLDEPSEAITGGGGGVRVQRPVKFLTPLVHMSQTFVGFSPIPRPVYTMKQMKQPASLAELGGFFLPL